MIIVKRVAALGVDGADARRHHRVVGHRKGQPVNDHATELLALHIHSLPERCCGQQHRVRREAELFQQGAARRRPLQQQRIFDGAKQALVDFAHLRVAGEQAKRPALRDLQDLADALGRPRGKLRGARIRQIWRQIQHGLLGVVEVRGHHQLARGGCFHP